MAGDGRARPRTSNRDHATGLGRDHSSLCGAKCITEVCERYAADCPQFAPLVKKTAESFKPREVSADAAYASYENMELVAGLGANPFILFPVNTTAARGGVFAKMFHYYSFNRDDFLTHYHKRSNVETTFSMIKAKFGDSLRSKTDAAMVNEALCKILAHNLCCLIQSQHELGVEAKFWGEDDSGRVSVEAFGEPIIGDDPLAMIAWM